VLGLGAVFLQLAGLFLVGSQPFSMFCLLIIDVGSLFLIYSYGFDAAALTVVVAISFHVTIAAVVKLLIAQPLEENLLVPNTTFAIETIYFLALVAAFYVVRFIHLPKLMQGRILDPDLLRNIAISTTIVSIGVSLISASQSAELAQQAGDAAAGSAPLAVAVRGFGTLGLVCAAARAVLMSNRLRLLDPLSFSILALDVIAGLSSNSREGVVGPIVTVVIAGLAFGYRPKVSTTIAAVVFAVLFVTYISPALILTRDKRDVLGPVERTAYALDVIGDLILDTPRAQEYRGLMALNEDTRFGRYFGAYNTVADRIALVQTVDLVAGGIQESDNLNYADLPNVFQTLLPENVFAWFGYERPAVLPVGDLVAWAAGISPFGFVSFLSVPESAEAYAVGGLPAVGYRTLVVYAFCFAIFYLFGGVDMRLNVFTITLFLMFYHSASEGISLSFYYFSLRIVPQFAISYFVIVKLCGLMTGSRSMKAI
jgi:hypothetical protein